MGSCEKGDVSWVKNAGGVPGRGGPWKWCPKRSSVLGAGRVQAVCPGGNQGRWGGVEWHGGTAVSVQSSKQEFWYSFLDRKVLSDLLLNQERSEHPLGG